LVEDEPALARRLADNFRDEGYEVRLLSRGDEVGQVVREIRPDVLVLDIMLPGRSGLAVLPELRTSGESLLLENLKLDELAAKQVYEFAFLVQPLKIQGGTGSTVAPVAIR
jgi:CheY-like chemotaxis protein